MDFLNSDEFNKEVQDVGNNIFQNLGDESASLFNKDWWYGKIMDWSMRDEGFKTQMFRFVDVLPYLNSNQEVTRHLKEYFRDTQGAASNLFNVGLGVGSLAPGLVAGAVRKNITQMAKMFITGESPEAALPLLKKARTKGLTFTVDLLGEATLSEKEALDYQSRYIELINWLSDESKNWEDHPVLDSDDQGAIPKVNVSVKLSALYSQINPCAWEASIERIKERLRPIARLAKARNVFINIDMEQYDLKDMTLQIFEELLLEEEFKSYPYFGIVIQAYLRDSYKDTQRLLNFCKKRGVPITIRLVKGAYWDYETIHADQMNWPIPVYTVKQESDHNFEKCAGLILENHRHIKLAAGTHNVRSVAAVLAMAEKLNIPPKAYEIQMLFGMADSIKKPLIEKGLRVREYATVGELIPGMAYLVRRLLENTSNESFLRSKFADNISTEKLLESPARDLKPSVSLPEPIPDRFYNEPLLDFTLERNRTPMKAALERQKKLFGQNVPLIINNKKIETGRLFSRPNPSHTGQLIAKVHMASTENADHAVKSATEAFAKWKEVNPKERSEVLRRLASLFRKNRFDLMALQVFETGKPWKEADGDIAEAIDFCEYYAREMLRLSEPRRVSYVGGESGHYYYIPKGVSLVIAPWNFPLAILCGMVAASVVTGNTVIMKPAEQSSVTAMKLMELLIEAGLPPGVVNFLPGYGEEVGAYLAAHKDIHMTAFTGSRAVGLKLLQQASQVSPGQKHVKNCIIEMGGKNAIIVDSDADLDEAVDGIVYSAFGFSGQKCSACSRVIVLEENYNRFLERFIEATRSIKVRPSDDPEAFLGPVIDEDAYKRILSTIEKAKEKHHLAFQGDVPKGGHFVPPTVFTEVSGDSELAQEEIFGPVVAIIKVKNLDEALEVANSTDYALTGGIYSRSPDNIEKARKHYDCGNFYINRSITGALVGRQPFGGHRLSGLGSKTGGPDYLIQFMHPRVVTENTMRRGFAPT